MRRYALAFLLSVLVVVPTFAKPLRLACVDCYSSASLYPAALAALQLGIEVEWVLVQTHPYTAGHEHYLKAFPAGSRRLVYDGQKPGWVKEAGRDLKALGIDHLLEGMDEGAFQGTLLAAELAMPHNPVDSREVRKRKDLQMAAAREHGIPTEDFVSVEQALAFAASFPQPELVVKFNDGVSGVGMEYFRKDDPDFAAKLAKKLSSSKVGPFGTPDKFILQPRIEGEKYFINTYVFEDREVVTGLSEYFMIDWAGTSLYFVDPMLDLQSPEAKALGPLAKKINAWMEVRRGASHLEFIRCRHTGHYYLLENNVRIAGAGIPALETAVYGQSQMGLHLLSLFDPAALRREMDKYPRKMAQGGMIVVIPSAHDGIFTAEAMAAITGLKSYFLPGPQYALAANSPVKATVDQNTAAALIHLTGHREQIRQGVEQIIALVESRRLVRGGADCGAQIAALSTVLREKMREVHWDALPAL